MDGGAWWATSPRGREESDMTKRLHFTRNIYKPTKGHSYSVLAPFPWLVFSAFHIVL